MQNIIQQLIIKAQNIMSHSADPVHDINHAQIVVEYAEKLCNYYDLSPEKKQAIILAAWWHDVGRTITKKPSFIWMPFFDDIISALMLWRETIFHGLSGPVVGLSTRIILCKSLGTGALFTKILLRKNNRLLMHIVDDADTLDTLNPIRTLKIHHLVESSRIYRWGYRTMIWWYINSGHLKVKTQAARDFLKNIIQTFLAWVKQAEIYAWHVAQFGIHWVEKNIMRSEKLLFKLCTT